MPVSYIEFTSVGKLVRVPTVEIEGRTVMARGGRIKTASVFDEAVTPGELVKNPETFVAALKKSDLKADVLTFFQRPPDVTPKFPYHYDWDNYAVIDTKSFDAWWEKLPQEARKNTRRAQKRGVEVKVVSFDDELVHGIHKLCNESPVRQGKPFWHYGKDFETVKRDHATYLDRSEFIGAYFEGELIGFIKMAYVDRIATIFHILTLNSHHDKRPINALVAKAVEVCAQKGMTYIVHDKYTYGNKKQSTLLEFKRRNGYEQVDYPRYYIPLTLKGRIFVALRLYRGAIGLLPAPVLSALLTVRGWFNRKEKPAANAAPAKEE